MTKTKWLFATRKAPAWIGEDDLDLVRPFIMVLMDENTGLVMGNSMEDGMPAFSDMADFIQESIHNPSHPGGHDNAPQIIVVENEAWVGELQPFLENAGISVEYYPYLYAINDMLLNMEAMTSGRIRRGLLTIPGITPNTMHAFYKAAASYFKAKPWKWVADSQPIEIRYPPTAPPTYAVIMGNGGETFGLAGYSSLDDLDILYDGGDTFDFDEEDTSWISLMFDKIYDLPFQEIDALEKHNWEIAASNAYPLTIKFIPPDKTESYNASDLAWMTATLQALPDFANNVMQANRGDLQEGRQIVNLTGGLAGQQIVLRYPAQRNLHSPKTGDMMGGMMDNIYDFVGDWDWEPDTEGEQFALEMGSFMVAFLTTRQMMGLSDSEIDGFHINLEIMGSFVCDEYTKGDAFSPEIFLRPPAYLKLYKSEISNARRDVRLYQETWRELGQFVKDMGLNAGTSPSILA